MKRFDTYVKPYLEQYKWLMSVAIFLGILTMLASSMLTFTSGYLISRAAEMPWNILMIYVPIVGVRFFGIARPVAHYLERLAGHNAVLKILSSMRVKLYEVLEPQALFIRSRFQTGDIIGTLAEDIEHLQDTYIRTIFPTVIALFLFLYSVITLAVFDWKFAIWMSVVLSVIVFVYPYLSLYMLKKRQMNLNEKRAHLYGYLTDTLFGISDWIISGKKKIFLEKFFTDSKETSVIEKKMTYWNHTRNLQLQFITGMILIMVGVWAGFMAKEGSILPTYIASFTLVTLPIVEGMLPISQAVEKIPSYLESMERMDNISKYTSKAVPAISKIGIPDQPDINIRELTYYYADETFPALNHISLKIPFGQKLAILGKSGSGKSTLLQLLYGALKPTTGALQIGNYQPYECGESIHEMISVLNQKPYLFATSVENNIRLGKPDATEDELREVIRRVKLEQYIFSLPKGMNTQMEETGQRFSGGERQRIALARILLKDTPIVILDEPTIGLDPQTEADLLATIFETLKEKTVILITHHLIGLENTDQILFLDKGTIHMYGNHSELLEVNPRYRQLYLLDRGEV